MLVPSMNKLVSLRQRTAALEKVVDVLDNDLFVSANPVEFSSPCSRDLIVLEASNHVWNSSISRVAKRVIRAKNLSEQRKEIAGHRVMLPSQTSSHKCSDIAIEIHEKSRQHPVSLVVLGIVQVLVLRRFLRRV